LFTSGSSGEPKGVPITQQGLADYVDFALNAYFDGHTNVVAPLFSALTFDLTVTTLFGPLLANGRLVIIGPDGTDALLVLAQRHDLTWIKATPSHLELLSHLSNASSWAANNSVDHSPAPCRVCLAVRCGCLTSTGQLRPLLGA
jgi:non-ribosomal peptide synthetase component F